MEPFAAKEDAGRGAHRTVAQQAKRLELVDRQVATGRVPAKRLAVAFDDALVVGPDCDNPPRLERRRKAHCERHSTRFAISQAADV